MTLWRDDVVKSLKNIGGKGHLREIYREVERVRKSSLPKSWKDIVRRELENNSSDSDAYKNRYDLFYSVSGIGAGYWGLR